MSRLTINRFFHAILLACLLIGAANWMPVHASLPAQTNQVDKIPHWGGDVRYAVNHDRSPELARMSTDITPGKQPAGSTVQLVPHGTLPLSGSNPLPPETPFDPVLQNPVSTEQMPAPEFNFEGINNLNHVLPPDPNGDVGPNHYVQWVNLSLAVWQLDRPSHTATLIFGPVSGNTIWSGFGGACETTNNGDPIVLYDHLADRWMISQFALPSGQSGPYYQCVAVSQTGDPTGAWYRYAFFYSDSLMNDYSKLAVWPDGYYMSANQFFHGGAWVGAGVLVFERDKMLMGLNARQVYFDLGTVDLNFGGLLPADLDGSPPPPGTPNLFAAVNDASSIAPADALRLWEFHVDWNQPDLSSFGLNGQPNLVLPVADFYPLCVTNSYCIPQPGTTVKLDAIGDRLLHRLQYRNFGSYVTLVANHSVDAGGGRAGIRWYELRNAGTGWFIQQQGTYAGDGSDSEHRWMGSIAMDGVGNISLGYSVSSSTVYPSIRYAGRLVYDPPGVLSQGEVSLHAGSGSQTYPVGRWGDYSMMSVDPTDHCTFWYTSLYYPVTSAIDWHTRIGSFKFPGCITTDRGILSGQVTDSSTGNPIANADVSIGYYRTLTDISGFYQFTGLPFGSYSVTAMHYGYWPATSTGVVIQADPVQLDLQLTTAPFTMVTGIVTDGSGQSWPLYTRVDINSMGYTTSVFTDPITGEYQVNLSVGSPLSLTASSIWDGYLSQTVEIPVFITHTVQNFSLLVDDTRCAAPGYIMNVSCIPQSGGLLVGHVMDANTSLGINGATVTSVTQPAEQALTQTTPADPAQPDGLYVLFSTLVGDHPFMAAKAAFASQTQSATIVAGKITPLDFSLPAGQLTIQPGSLDVYLIPNDVVTRTLQLSNTGMADSTYTISWETFSWLNVTPISGTLSIGKSQTILLTFNTLEIPIGSYTVNLVIANNTPYGSLSVPLSLPVRGRYNIFMPLLNRRMP